MPYYFSAKVSLLILGLSSVWIEECSFISENASSLIEYFITLDQIKDNVNQRLKDFISMKVIKTTESYEIIDAGSVIIPYGEYIEFHIVNLKFRIVFKEELNESDESSKQGRLQYDVKGTGDEAYMEIALYNQNQSFFSGLNEMIDLATIDNRKLWFMFRIQSLNSGSSQENKLLYYTWYYGKALVSDGSTLDNSKIEEE